LRREPEHALIELVNWHEIIEQRSYDLHQVVASVLMKDQAQLERVVEWIKARLADPNYAVQSKDALQEWLMLIDQRGLAGVLEVLSDAGEEARRLRHSSPFGVIMPQKERTEIFQRYEARRPRTHPASV
jgi:hypothetical protein